MVQVEFFFEEISEFLSPCAEFKETIQVLQVLIADGSGTLVELFDILHIRLFRHFRNLFLLTAQLA